MPNEYSHEKKIKIIYTVITVVDFFSTNYDSSK